MVFPSSGSMSIRCIQIKLRDSLIEYLTKNKEIDILDARHFFWVALRSEGTH